MKKVFYLAALILVLATVMHGVAQFKQIQLDDSYITYRMSRNLANGDGLVFNIGERHLATSAPGYAFLLAGGASILGTESIPSIAIVISTLSLTAIAFLAFLVFSGITSSSSLVGKTVGSIAGLFTAAMLALSPTLLFTIQNEMLLQAALILSGFYMLSLKRSGWGTGLLITATIVRPDGMIALIIGAFFFGLVEKKWPIKQALGSFVVLSVFALAALAYYGYVLPPTMAAKKAHMMLGNPDFRTLAQFLPDYITTHTPFVSPRFWLGLVTVCVVVICFRGARDERWKILWPILAWGFSHALFFQVQKVAYYPWYLVPAFVAVYFCLGGLVLATLQLSINPTLSKVIAGLALVGVVAFALKSIATLYWDLFAYPIVYGGQGFASLCALVGTSFMLIYLFVRLLWNPAKNCSVSLTRRYLSTDKGKFLVIGVMLASYVFVTQIFPLLEDEYTLMTKQGRTVQTSFKFELYRDIGLRLDKANAESVGHCEIGVIGWFAPKTRIVDPLGLATEVDLATIRESRLAKTYSVERPEYIVDVHWFRVDLFKDTSSPNLDHALKEGRYSIDYRITPPSIVKLVTKHPTPENKHLEMYYVTSLWRRT